MFQLSREGYRIFIIVCVLIAVGVVMVYSASAIYAYQFFKSSSYFLKRQLLFVLLGFAGFFGSFFLNLDFLRRHSRKLVLAAIFLLVLVLFIGRAAGGAQRWIGLGSLNLQPVEFAKIAFCIFLADYLSRRARFVREGRLKVFFTPLAILFIVSGLVLAQPDLGSTAFLFMITCILLFVAGLRKRWIAAAFGMLVPALILLIVFEPYRMKRLVAYANPWSDPRGTGYQIIQSFTAFGAGGLKGVGLGAGTQKLFYLPQSYSDFIFSIIGEETGLIGAAFVLVLFALFVYEGITIARRAANRFYRLLAFSLTLLVGLQALLNISVTVGLVPTKGCPLPFISYGGSSLIFNMIAVGLLLAVDRKTNVHEEGREQFFI
ncbi:MAG: putative lipid II flippase FtsW [Candidatus Omnitrophica bacterium]|nr:putative lipid II flippase FtsW [Candidatus Omnitrophota bacterium]